MSVISYVTDIHNLNFTLKYHGNENKGWNQTSALNTLEHSRSF